MDVRAPSGAAQAEELGQAADRRGRIVVVEVLPHEPEHAVAEGLQVGIAVAIELHLPAPRVVGAPVTPEEAEEGAFELRARVGLLVLDELAAQPAPATAAGPLPGRRQRAGVEL